LQYPQNGSSKSADSKLSSGIFWHREIKCGTIDILQNL
jgi:hypothetical protein